MVVAALAAQAGTALVQAMVADGWKGMRSRVARLFGRGEADPAIERRLDAAREQLAAAPPSELTRVQTTLANQWQTRFEDLLADYPGAQAELAALVDELNVVMSASGHSVAAAGDMNVAADHGGVAAGVIHGDVRTGPTRPDPAFS